MTIAVCQGYWAPYAGYYRLFAAADMFVFFDDVQFPRRGWVHRYKDAAGRWVTLPLKKAPRDTMICTMQFPNGQYLADFVYGWMQHYTEKLDLVRPMPRSSSIYVDPALRGQDHVIAICKHFGATRYVNPSGGRALYDAPTFAKAGIELGFLKPYEGSYESILTRLQTERAEAIAAEIRRETVIEWMS